MDTLIAQFFNFLMAIGIGLIIGVLFDVYRGLWKKCTPPFVIMPIWDIFWWLIVTLLVFLTLLHLTWGELRLYIFLGQIIGFVFYLKKISRYFLKNFIKFLYWMEKTIKKVIMILFIPFRIIKRIFLWPFKVIRFFLYKVKRYLKKAMWLISLLLRAIPRKCMKRVKKFFFKTSRNKK